MSLTFLVLREGPHYHTLKSLRFLIPNCSVAGLIYFGWDLDPSVFLGYVVNVSKSDSSLH